MGSDPYSSYKSTQVETASQEKILLMLYDGCIKYTRQAKLAMNNDNQKVSHEKLIQAQDIITELMSTLDMEVGGEVAEELFRLYDFCLHNLIQANVENDPSRLEDVLPVLEDLKETWDEVINEKGMTVEKARREMGRSPSESPTEEDSSPDESQSDDRESKSSDASHPSQTPTSPDDSLEGNVTYGDI